MKFTQNTKGFTLIELLVVITIIGILAVGGTATYTAQIQKARDSTRLTDINAIRSGIEQFYQDFSEYPDVNPLEFTGSGARSVTAYVPKIPRDGKSGQMCSNGGSGLAPACDYIYNVGVDANGINKGRYRVSTAFENKGNVGTKAGKDGGSSIEVNRFELGLEIAATTVPTSCERTANMGTAPTATVVVSAATCNDATNFPTGALLIAGN